MADVGIKLSMTENVSAMSPKVSSALRDISSAGEEMKDALQLGDLEEKYRQFASRVDKLYDTQQANRQQQQEGTRQQRDEDRQALQTQQRLSTLPTQVISGVGVAATKAGGGDVAGAGAGLFGLLTGLLKSIGPLGAVVGLAGAGAMAGMAVEQQYEKQLPGVMALSAALGRLSKETGAIGDVFRDTMAEVAEAGKEYVYSLEESTAIFQQFARAGGLREEYVPRAMEYARGYAADPSALAGFLGTYQRFGGVGNILGRVAGGLEESGMQPARYQEFLESTLSIFEEGIARGVVKGFEGTAGIIGTQTWLAQYGEIFTGQSGLNIYRKMESATVGATALSREQDIILFRAAREALLAEGKDASYIEIMKRLEKGIDKEIFGFVKEQVLEMTTSPTEQAISLQSIFKDMSMAVIEKLLTAPAGEVEALIAEAPKIDSPEARILRAQLGISQQIRNFGAEIVRTKAWAVEGAEKIIDGLAWIMGMGQPTQEDVQTFLRTQDERLTEGRLRTGTMEGVTPLRTGLEELMAYALAQGPYVTTEQTATAKEIESVYANMTPEQRHALSGPIVTPEGALHGSLFDFFDVVMWKHMAPGETDAGKSLGDLSEVLIELNALLKSLDTHIAEDKITNISIEEPGTRSILETRRSGLTE